jgi:hypothetical protein
MARQPNNVLPMDGGVSRGVVFFELEQHSLDDAAKRLHLPRR